MRYELWDLEAGRGIGRYATEAEATALVRLLIGRFGPAYANDLDLAAEDDEGNTVETLTGPALLNRAGIDPAQAVVGSAPRAR